MINLLNQSAQFAACRQRLVPVPFQVRPLPKEPPLIGGSNVFELRDRGLDRYRRIIPFRPPLKDNDLMSLHAVFQTQLVLEMRRTALAAKPAHEVVDLLSLGLAKRHIAQSGKMSRFEVSVKPGLAQNPFIRQWGMLKGL